MKKQNPHPAEILMIINDPQQSVVFKEKMTRYGYGATDICTGGEEALELARSNEYRLVISDVELKGSKDGIDTCRALTDTYGLPVIYLSRRKDEETFQRARKTNPWAFLGKPVSWVDLRMAIENALEKSPQISGIVNGRQSLDSRYDSQRELNELREREQDYRLLYEEAPLAYQSLNPDGTIRRVNRAWCDLTGISMKIAIGTYFGDLLTGEDKESFAVQFSNFKQLTSVYDIEYTLVHATGRTIRISVDGHAIRDSKSNYRHSHCILRDITIESELRKELKINENKFRTLFAVSADALFLADAESGKILDANESAAKLLEKPVKEIIGMHQKDLHPEDQFKLAIESFAFRPDKMDETPPAVQIDVICPDGKRKAVEITGKFFRMKGGEFVFGSFRDISERKRMEEENRFHAGMLDSVGQAVMATDAGGRIIYWNSYATRLYGWTKEEVSGKNILDVTPSPDMAAQAGKIMKILREGRQWQGEFRVRNKDGKEFFAWVKDTPIRNEQGELIGIIGISEDITESKKQQQRIAEATGLLTQTGRMTRVGGWEVLPATREVRWSQVTREIHEVPDNYRPTLDEAIAFFPGESGRTVSRCVEEALKCGKSFDVEVEFRTAKGKKLWTRAMGRAETVDGTCVRLWGTFQDVTENRRIRQELIDTNEELTRHKLILDQILENTEDHTYVFDREHRFKYASRSGAEALGMEPEHMVGKHWKELGFPEAAMRGYIADLILAFERVQSVRGALEFPTNAGPRNYEYIISPLKETDKSVRYVLNISRDITERIRTERKLRKTTGELKLLNTINRLANEGASLKKISKQLSIELAALYGISGTSLYLLDDHENTLIPLNFGISRRETGLIEELIGTKIPQVKVHLKEGGWYDTCLKSGQLQVGSGLDKMIAIANEFTDKEHFRKLIPQLVKKLRVRHVLAFPLLVDNKPVGVMDLSGTTEIGEEEVRSVERISKTVATIISRKRAVELLVTEEEKYRNLFNMAPTGIVTLDTEGYIRTVNHAICTTTGLDNSNLINKHFAEIPVFRDADTERFVTIFKKILRKERSRPVEFAWHHSDGSLRWGEAFFSLVYEKDRKTGIQVMINETTERRKAEEYMRRSALIINTTSDAVVSIDPEEKIFSWNSGAERIFGYPAEEAVGQHASMIFEEEERAIIEDKFGRLVKGKEVEEREFRCIHKSGKTVHALVSLSSLLDESGNVSELVGIAKDITQLKQSEERFRYKSEFEKIVSGITSKMINLKSRNVEAAIHDALKQIGEFLGLDRCSLGYMDKDKQEVIIADAWNRTRIKGFRTRYRISDFPWMLSSFHTGEAISWRRGDKRIKYTPAEKQLLEKASFHSFKVIPVLVRNRMVYCMSFFNSNRQRDLTDLFEDRLKQLGLSIGNALLRKMTDDELRARERKYRYLFQNMAQGAFYQHSDGAILDVNKAALKMFGLTKTQLLGRTSMEPDWKVINEKGKELSRKDHPSMISLRTGKKLKNAVIGIFNRKLDEIVWLSVNTHPQVRPGEEKPYQVFVTMHDLTRIKRTEEQLKKRNRFIETVMDNLPLGLAVNTINDGKASYMNRMFEKTYGWPAEKISDIGAFFRLVYPDPAYRKEIYKRIMSDIESGDSERMKWDDVEITTQDGSKRIIQARNIPLYDQNQMISTVQDVTDIKLAQKALQEERDRASQYLDIAASIIVALDRDGYITLINNEGARLLEVSKEEAIGKNWFDNFLEPEQTGKVKRIFEALMRGNTQNHDFEENAIRTGSGKVRAIRWHNSLIRDLDGTITGTLSSGEDITQRLEAEKALRESELKYKDLVEKSGVAIVVDDRKGNLGYFNKDFAHLFGYSVKEMSSLGRPDLFLPEEAKKIDRYHGLRMNGKRAPGRYELKGLKKNGETFWIEVKSTILKDGEDYRGTRNYIWDITERKEAEKALAESENRFRELFSRMNSGVLILDPFPGSNEFTIRNLNRAATLMLDLNISQIVNKPFRGAIPRLNDPALHSKLESVACGGASEFFPLSDFRNNTLHSYLEIHVYGIPNGEVVLVLEDFTERITAELELSKSYQEIRKLTRHIEEIREEERRQMANNLHDELGQVLTAIKMDVSWIRNRLPGDQAKLVSKSDETLAVIDQAISGIRQITSELRPPILDNLGLFEALRSLVADFRKRTKIDIQLQLPPHERDFRSDFKISVYRIIQEGLTNVARHSKATRAGLTINEKNNILGIELRDNGIGIPGDKIQSSESLGLIGSKERVMQWNGEYNISGEAGKGTEVKIALPLPEKK